MPSELARRAEELRALHHAKRPLLLVNAWDVASARLVEETGAPAVATSSGAVSVALGYPDGERIPREEMMAAVARIAKALSVPLSADVEGGYGPDAQAAAATARAVIAAGAVGLNFEDSDPRAVGGLRDLESQLARLRAIRRVAEESGVPLVLNARTDVFLRWGERPEEERVAEAVRRGKAYRDAGADCVYPIGSPSEASIARLVREIGGPINMLGGPGMPNVPTLARLGVARVSLGSLPARAALGLLGRVVEELNGPGTYELLGAGGPSHDELNRLALPRKSRPTPAGGAGRGGGHG